MTGILSPQEQRLVVTLVDWLHDQMVKSLTNTSPAPDLLHDLAQSNFETGCGALARVGVLARRDVLAGVATQFGAVRGEPRRLGSPVGWLGYTDVLCDLITPS